MRHPPSTAAQLSFFAQPRSSEDLSLRGGLLLSSATARGVGALGLAVTVLDPWIDTACGVTGGVC